MSHAIALVVIAFITTIQCSRPDNFGKGSIESLRQGNIPEAFTLSLMAMNEGSTNSLVCYIAAMAKFSEGDLVSCMDYANRIGVGDTMYSRARVIYTSAWVQQNPDKAVPKGLIDSLEKQIKAETDDQDLSILYEARQLVYRQLWYQADSTDENRPALGMKMMMSALVAVKRDSLSLPSWKVLVDRHLIRGVPEMTDLIYRTAGNVASDDRIFLPQKLGILYMAMQTAADHGEIDNLRQFAKIYLSLEPSEENQGFSIIASLKPNTSTEQCQQLLQAALQSSSTLQDVLLQCEYPRILMPRLG